MRLLSYILDLFLPRRQIARAVDEINEREFLGKIRVLYNIDSTIITLLPYSDTQVKACILEAKFHRNERAISLLGAMLREYLLTIPGDLTIIPLPLSVARRKKRGHNQLESVIRNAVRGKILERIHINSSLLVRVRNTVPQTTLSGVERRKNVSGAFAVAGPLNPHPTYILVDDVTTTGSTLKEAVETLRRAGAIHVISLALADSS